MPSFLSAVVGVIFGYLPALKVDTYWILSKHWGMSEPSRDHQKLNSFLIRVVISFNRAVFINNVLRDGMLLRMGNISPGLFCFRLIARTRMPIVP